MTDFDERPNSLHFFWAIILSTPLSQVCRMALSVGCFYLLIK